MKAVFGRDKEVGEWVAKRIPLIGRREKFGQYSSIGIEDKGKLIAGCVYSNYTSNDIYMNFAADNKKWANKENLNLFFAYPFYQLKLPRVSAFADKGNRQSRRLIEGVGFKYEGKKRKIIDGRHDAIMYGMLIDECKYLIRSRGNGQRSASGSHAA